MVVRGNSGAVGYDLSLEEYVIIVGKSVMKMELAVSIPLGTYAWITLHLGLAVK